jgi:hypothetical protein
MKVFFTSKKVLDNPYVIKHIFENLGYKIIVDEKKRSECQIIWKWEDLTHKKILINGKKCVINGNVTDISKTKVMKCFEKVFDYSLNVDPLKCQEPFVIKNDINAKHDGFISKTPLDSIDYERYISKGMIFQKLIDNEIDGKGTTKHYRVPVFFCKAIPMVYEYYVNRCYRFRPRNDKTLIKEVQDVFTSSEIENILLFCKEMCLDYCELDILRDVNDEKIYIIDANDTPTVTTNGYSKVDFQKAIEIQAECFKKYFKLKNSVFDLLL